jgi:hypothetical protein
MIFIEKFGYFLSEAPALIFMTWFAVRWVQLCRKHKNQPIYMEKDWHLLRRPAEYGPLNLRFYPRFALAVLAVTTTGALEFFALAPFGAAILTGAFLLTSAAIVQRLLF